MRHLLAALCAVCMLVLISTRVEARRSEPSFDRHAVNQQITYIHTRAVVRWRITRVAHRPHRTAAHTVRYVGHPSGCPPRLFCGCGVALHIFGKPVRAGGLAIAANWLRFPRAAAAPGMVAARYGHVFAILRLIRPGVVLAYDPNSGRHRTRIHERSLAGFRVVNPHARRVARVGV